MRKRYFLAVSALLQDWKFFSAGSNKHATLGEAVTSDIEHLWTDGEAMGQALDCLGGVQYFYPAAIGNL